MVIQVIKRREEDRGPSQAQRNEYMVDRVFDFAQGAQNYYQQQAKEKQILKQEKEKEEKENAFLKKLYGTDLEGATPKEKEIFFTQKLKEERKRQELKDKMDAYKKFGFGDYLYDDQQFQSPDQQSSQLRGDDNQTNPSFSDQINRPGIKTSEGNLDLGGVSLKSNNSGKEYPEGMIMQAEIMGDHGLAQQMKGHNDRIFEEKKNRRKIFEADRAYHTKFSAEAEAHANAERMSLPKKEASLDYARGAIESGEIGYFSADKLADATGIDLFRTSKGAQLTTAGKENLLSNMSRVTGRAQNMWFEQRLNSMFPKIGQSKEANLTVQEMLEGELELDKAYLNAFDKIAARDEEDYGYVRKDIQKRAYDEIKPLEKDIMQRTTYRMKEIEEMEMGTKGMKAKLDKKVPKGTPLTLAMTKLLYDRHGEKTYQVAKDLGYYIPTLEEFERYQAPHSVMSEGL